MSQTAEYTMSQVADHKSPDDLWMVIHEKVYEVTKYLKDHPGGAEVLAEAAGGDASEDFDNAGHSEDAFKVMEDFCIGELKSTGKKITAKAVKLRTPAADKVDQPQVSHRRGQLVNLALFSVGAIASSYAVHKFAPASWHIHLPKVAPSLPWTSSQNGGYGFAEGLLVGAGVFTIVDTFLATKILALIRGESKSFSKYPPHFKKPATAQADILARRGWLDPITYYPLPLIKKVLVSPDVYRFTFALPTPQTIIGLPIGQHVAIKAEVNGETVSRSYTPVSNNSNVGILELVIKVYSDGKLTSGFLKKLNIGDEVLFRGPKGAMRYSKGLCKKIGMVAGGTGITPMFQLIRAICENDRDTTEISLIFANRTEDDILLRLELDTYARRYPKNLKIHYMLDHPPADWKYGSGYVTQDIMKERFPEPSVHTKILLCGPPGMVNAAKKSLGNLGYEMPGAISKMTDQVFLF